MSQVANGGIFRRLAFWSRAQEEGDLPPDRGTKVVFYSRRARDGVTYIVAQIDDEPVSAEQTGRLVPGVCASIPG